MRLAGRSPVWCSKQLESAVASGKVSWGSEWRISSPADEYLNFTRSVRGKEGERERESEELHWDGKLLITNTTWLDHLNEFGMENEKKPWRAGKRGSAH